MMSYGCTAQGQISCNFNSSHTATDTVSDIVCLMLLSLKAENKPMDSKIMCITRSSEMVQCCAVCCFLLSDELRLCYFNHDTKTIKRPQAMEKWGIYFYQAVNELHKQCFILK